MDLEFFEQMAFPLFDSLYNLAHWLTGDRTEAEDLVQETYTKVLRGFKSFQEGHEYPPMDVPYPALSISCRYLPERK